MSEPCVQCADTSQALVAFGHRVRALRESAGLRQQDIADKAGLTRSSIANIEAGRQDTTVTVLLALAAALGTTVGALLGEQPDQPTVPISLLTRIAGQQRRITSAFAEAAVLMERMGQDADEMRTHMDVLGAKP